MANRTNNSLAQATRRKLIDAAGNLFAEVGYRHVTLREITRRAETSVGSVNYHFKNKAGIFNAVVESMAEVFLTMYPPEACLIGTPEDQLNAWVCHVLEWLLSDRYPRWTYPLWIRESRKDPKRMEPIYGRAIRPYHDRLSALLSKFATVPLTPLQISMTAAGIMGQCVHFMNERHIAGQLYGDWEVTGKAPEVEVFAEHIVRWVFHGILTPSAPRVTKKRSGRSNKKAASKHDMS